MVLSPGYKTAIVNRGIPADKIEVVYNWCDASQENPADAADDDPFSLHGFFNVMYAGNFGPVQALDAVVRAAALLKEKLPAFRMVFIGNGVEEERLKKLVIAEKTTNVIFIPRQPVERIGELLAKADALLIHLRNDPLCRIGVPQKTQAYLAAGKPIIMAVEGDASELVKTAAAGITCQPENPESIAQAIIRLAEMSDAERTEMAENGRCFYRNRLCFAIGSRKMENIFSGVAYAKPS